MTGGTTRRVAHASRLLAAGVIALAATFIPTRIASAATVDDTASAIVTLDVPGTVTLDAFDPTRGTLTSVQVSLTVDVLVQACVENAGQTEGSTAGGTATASLAAQFPGGAAATTATVGASVDPVSLPASDGTTDCAEGFDDATGSFPDDVTAGDAAYFEGADQATGAATITDTTAMAPFVGTGTVAVAYTPTSDTELVLPAEWDNLAVAQGQITASVTYTFTPAGGATPPPTDVIGQLAEVATANTIPIVIVLVGLGGLLAAYGWRSRHAAPPSDSG